MTSLEQMLGETPYTAYSYAYPHKTAYRPLDPAVVLRDLWAEERRDALFLYVHIPFCEIRCGFCNLFTTLDPRRDWVADYLRVLAVEAERVGDALGPAVFARMAVGGGTPTFLDAEELHRLFGLAQRCFGVDARAILRGDIARHSGR